MKTIPARSVPYGATFKVFGEEYVALDYINGAVLALRKAIWKRAPFDTNGKNDLRSASIVEELSAYISGLWSDTGDGMNATNTVLAEVDLKATDGTREYGTFGMRAALLTLEQYGKYQHIIPDVDGWWWLATPVWTPAQKGGDDHYAWVVYTGGGCDGYYCTDTYGIRPALYLTPSLLVSIEDEGEEAPVDECALYREYREYIEEWAEDSNHKLGDSPATFEEWKTSRKDAGDGE